MRGVPTATRPARARPRGRSRPGVALALPALLFLAGAAAARAQPSAAPTTAPAAPSAPAPFALRDGDRVVFYGDSITQDGGYARLVEQYVATRFPDWDVRFYNAGVGGDTVSGGWAGGIEERLERDVLAHRPTVVTVMLGMNDGGYKPHDPQTFAAYAEGYRSIVTRLKDARPGLRLALIQPSPFDDVTRPPGFKPGYDDVLRRYGCYVTALAARERVDAVDVRQPLNAGLTAVHATHPELSRHLLPDRVHPSAAGHLVMGAALLRAWNAPSLVSRVEIDAARSTLVAAENTHVDELEASDSGLQWTQLDRALPLPLNFDDAEVALAERAGAGLEELDRQPLAVTGLAPGSYELRIDGETVGSFTASELAAGIDLATRGTPMRWQAYAVRWSVEDRHELERVRRGLLAAGGEDPKPRAAAEVLLARDETLQRQRQEAAQPKPRRFELVPEPADDAR